MDRPSPRQSPAARPGNLADVVPDPLDIAYIAMGARQALAEWRDGPPAPFPFEGELAYIEACIEQAPALQRAWEAVQDRLDFVWCYEVAEPFGLAYGRHLLQGGGPDAAAGLLHDLVGDALLPPSA